MSLYFRSPTFLKKRIEEVEYVFQRIRSKVDNPEQVINIGTVSGENLSFKRKDLDDILEKRKALVHEEWLIKHFAQWQEFVEFKINCGLDVITVPEEIPLITSDNPVLLIDMDGRINDEIFSLRNLIEIPLDRQTYLIIHPNITGDRTYHRIHRSERDKMFAGALNRRTEENSNLRIVSFPGDLKKHFEVQPSLDEWSLENIQALNAQIKKTELMGDLMLKIKQHGTFAHPDVAQKVREIRLTGLLKGERLFETLIVELAKRGFFTA